MRVPRLEHRSPRARPLCAPFLTAIVALAAAITSIRADDGDLVGEFEHAPRNQRILSDREIGGQVDGFFYGRFNGESPQDALDARLRKKVAEVARTAGLSHAQKEKLLLAGAGDIHRFVDQINAIKIKFQAERPEMRDLNVFFSELLPFTDVGARSTFDANSLFGKTLAAMLTREQLDHIEKVDQERQLFQHRAGVRMTALRLTTALGLSDEQRQRLEHVLFQETRPTRITGPAFPAACALAVYVQISHIPEARLKPILEPWQWQALRHKMAERQKYVEALRASGIDPQGEQVAQPQAAWPPQPW